MNYEIDGIVALLSGGSSGIGPSTAQLLLEQGAQVAITDTYRSHWVQDES